MITAPTTDEWLFIYSELAIVLAVAVGIELSTKRIPNLLSLAAFLFFLGCRLFLGPEPAWHYLLSLVIVAVYMLGFAWQFGFLGGGSAKLAIGIAAALLPWMAIALCALPFLFWAIAKLYTKLVNTEIKTIPGSILLTVAVALVLGVAVLAGT